MNKKGIVVLLIGLLSVNAHAIYAQQQAAVSFTLDQAIQYALEHSVAAKNAMLDQQISEAKVKETTGIGLPQISGSASVIDNPKLPRFYQAYSTAPGSFSFIDPTKYPGLKNGDVYAAQNFLQLRSNGGVSATANQILFSGSYLVGLKAAKTYRELSLRNLNETKEQVIIQVTKAFYGVIINKERTDLFTNNINRVDSLLKNTKALNENGFAESIDVDRIQVNLNNLIVERDKFLNLNELSLELLKFQMNFPMDQTISVAGTIQDVQVADPVAEYQQDWDIKQRPDYQTLETNRKLQELNIRNKYAAGLPSLNAFATYGYSTQSNGVGGIFKTKSAFQEDNLVGRDSWYDYSQIGVTMSIPIFSGFQRHYQVQQEKINMMKIDNNFIGLKNSIDLEIKQSTVNFRNALKSLGAQKSNMELAGKVARVTKIKYEEGVGSNIEVVDAENSLRQAQTNYYNALYDAMIAKVDIDKAFGKILSNTAETTK